MTMKPRKYVSRSMIRKELLTLQNEVLGRYRHLVPVSQIRVASEAGVSRETLTKMYGGTTSNFDIARVLREIFLEIPEFGGTLPEDLENFFNKTLEYHGRESY